MTVIPIRPGTTASTKPNRRFMAARAWFKVHKTSILVLIPLVLVAAATSFWNFYGYGPLSNDDEGTYWNQAWAIYARGDLAHYTYWYDHPPFGWMQISAWGWLTQGFHRGEIGVLIAREVMAIANIASAVLLYVLMRRLRFHRIVASIAVLLFVLSPVAILYHRQVYLDNLEVAWLLAAMVCAVSPKRSIGSAICAGLCLAAATMSKETAGVLLPVVFMLIWQNRPKGDRSWSLSMFVGTYGLTCSFYLLYATLKGELLAGPGHVSIEYALRWQLFDRAGTGSVLDEYSVSRALVMEWLGYDNWLPWAALALFPIGLVFKRLRPFTVGYGVQVLLLFREGYTPQAYIVALLPFAAILVAGALGETFRTLQQTKIRRAPSGVRRIGQFAVAFVCALVLFGTLASFGRTAVPQWSNKLTMQATSNSTQDYRDVLNWTLANVPKDARIVSDDNFMYDLQKRGYKHVDWFYKVDLDPAVKKHYPNGWRDVDYYISIGFSDDLLRGQPTIYQAIEHGTLVLQKGDDSLKYNVWRVKH